MADHLEYFQYLKKRSFKGLLYRNFVVYPRIQKYIRGNLLDVGCGIGDMLKFYPNSVGADINPHTVNYCNLNGTKAYLIKQDVLPFEQESFDTVLLDNVLEHLISPMPLLHEINRVMRGNGRLIIGLPGERGFLMDDDHKVNYTEFELSKLLKILDFGLVAKFSTPFESRYLSKHVSRYCNFYVAIKRK